MEKAFFFDKDGVINQDKPFSISIEELEFLPKIFEAMRYLQAKGYKIIIVTNQSGIARGLYTEEDFHKLMDFLVERLRKEGVRVVKFYYCPHMPDDGCECRKPNPGNLLAAAKEFNIDLSQSFMIGDREGDVMCGKNAAVKKTIRIKPDGEDTVADHSFSNVGDFYMELLSGQIFYGSK